MRARDGRCALTTGYLQLEVIDKAQHAREVAQSTRPRVSACPSAAFLDACKAWARGGYCWGSGVQTERQTVRTRQRTHVAASFLRVCVCAAGRSMSCGSGGCRRSAPHKYCSAARVRDTGVQ